MRPEGNAADGRGLCMGAQGRFCSSPTVVQVRRSQRCREPIGAPASNWCPWRSPWCPRYAPRALLHRNMAGSSPVGRGAHDSRDRLTGQSPAGHAGRGKPMGLTRHEPVIRQLAARHGRHPCSSVRPWRRCSPCSAHPSRAAADRRFSSMRHPPCRPLPTSRPCQQPPQPPEQHLRRRRRGPPPAPSGVSADQLCEAPKNLARSRRRPNLTPHM